jgi:phenylalanyl-tRNA synthetase beta chain
MLKRLEAVGLRAINNIVDVTNYVMFEMGQPLHAFDFDKLRGRKIVVRSARRGEKLVSIDGHERKLDESMLAIADAEQAVALAGVMGGIDSEVSDATINVLLESARFDALSVRRTSRALGLKSDASYRFERGIDPTLAERASLRAAQLMLETAGGELLAGIVQSGSGSPPARQLSLRLSKLNSLLGVELPTSEVVDALRRLGLSPAERGGSIECTIPPHRLDLNIEVDLIEEAARVIGYDRIPMRDQIEIRLTPPEPSLKTIEKIRETLVSAGYFEAVTFSFVSDALAGDFLPEGAQSLPRADTAVRRADAHLRSSILPGLLEAVRRNETNGVENPRLFEIGSTFHFDVAGKLQEIRRIGIAGSSDIHELRGAVEALLSVLDKDKVVRMSPAAHRGYAPGICADIHWASQFIGELGLIDPSTSAKLDLRSTPSCAELDLEPLLAGAQRVPQLHPLPRFPAVRRDLSFILKDQTRFAELEAVVRNSKPESLEDLEYVTTYRGKPLEKGTKSVTITLVFRSPTGTLTSDAVEASVQKVTIAAEQMLGAKLRT